ncbi:MAG: hypothetical protein IIY02_00050 [Firmicutes bacterium]|nr:hypothetical protein [Bacillota bacterium]
MKKKLLCAILAFAVLVVFSACGKTEEEPAETESTDYVGSSIVISSFTEIAGENVDEVKETDSTVTYIYEVRDSQIGAAAYNLYKDYLDENFTYSSIDSTVVADGFCAVYYAANDAKIEYTERVDKDGAYTISVCIPK